MNVTPSLTSFVLFHLSCVFSSEEMSFSLSSLSTDYKGSKNGKTFKQAASVGFQDFGGMKHGCCGLFIHLYKHVRTGGYEF